MQLPLMDALMRFQIEVSNTIHLSKLCNRPCINTVVASSPKDRGDVLTSYFIDKVFPSNCPRGFLFQQTIHICFSDPTPKSRSRLILTYSIKEK